MRFVHQDPEFGDLLRIVARDIRLSNGLVEKDYWITHVLWTLHRTRLDVWLKGGTSLSKGFGLIERFSEDLDLQIEPGAEPSAPAVTSWKSLNKGPVAQRRAFYEALPAMVVIDEAPLELDRESLDKHARGAAFRVAYPGRFLGELLPAMRPFVLLEVGQAQVTPFVATTLSSFVHDWLERNGRSAEYEDARPRGIRCVHPLVTLLEKIDAIVRRFHRGVDPASFIRHYHDAARIIEARGRLPETEMSLAELIRRMEKGKVIRPIPSADDPAFSSARSDRWTALEKASEAIAPMFWGDRPSLARACEAIRGWLGARK